MKIIFHKLDFSGRNRKSERRERLCVWERERERERLLAESLQSSSAPPWVIHLQRGWETRSDDKTLMTGNQLSENKKYFQIRENAENTRKYYMLISLVSWDVFFIIIQRIFILIETMASLQSWRKLNPMKIPRTPPTSADRDKKEKAYSSLARVTLLVKINKTS